MVHTAGEKFRGYNDYRHQPEEDDATARFYKARMHKEKSTATGRTPIYDFDEWTRNHYTNTFKGDQKKKQFNAQKEEQRKVHMTNFRSEMSMLGTLGSATLFLMVMAMFAEMKRDMPQEFADKEKAEREREAKS